MADYWDTHRPGIESPAEHAAAVAKSDSTTFADITRAVWVGTGGDLVELVGGAPGHAGDVALAGKALGNGAASGVARPDHQGHAAWLFCLRHTRVSIGEGVRWCPPGQ